MPRFFEQSLAGWGNFRPELCRVYRPERVSELRATVTESNTPATTIPVVPSSTDLTDPTSASIRTTLIPRGLGRSYGDSAVNAGGGVVLQQRMDCLVSFDEATGVVEAEGGVSLATLIDLFLPRGFFLPVTPGTKFVTLGGAIAADVHGKNHHVDGTIGNFVESFRLMTGDGEVLACSREQNADVFWATIGGMGLTGIILSARLKLIGVSSAYVKVKYTRAPSLDAAIDHFESDASRGAKYSVAWIDCLSAGASLGRSVIMEGDHLPAAELAGRRARKPLEPKRKRRRSIRFFFPRLAMSRFNVRMFNRLYYRRHGDGTRIVDFDSFFYPLDAIHHWNRIYGRRGFIQYQALFPPATARQGLRELLEKISLAGQASFLAVLKRTGEQGPGLLSFPMPGYTLALDFPNRGEKLESLVRGLDEVLLRHGGRLYLAKDAMMSADTFAKMYPRLDEFRVVKAKVDPSGTFSSTQARRVGLALPATLGGMGKGADQRDDVEREKV